MQAYECREFLVGLDRDTDADGFSDNSTGPGDAGMSEGGGGIAGCMDSKFYSLSSADVYPVRLFEPQNDVGYRLNTYLINAYRNGGRLLFHSSDSCMTSVAYSRLSA